MRGLVMRSHDRRPLWAVLVLGLAAIPILAGPARGEDSRPTGTASAEEKEKKGGPVVRTYGVEGGYRTEVRSEARGTLSEEERRQAALLTAQVFRHIDEARRAIVAAKRDAVEVTGLRVVGSETITTEAVADLDVVEAQLARAARSLEDRKADAATQALTAAQVRGVEFFSSKEDAPLAEARDALWLARRSLEEN